MHLLAAQAGAIQQEGEAIDLGQTPGRIVFASAADSELAALAGAVDRAGARDVRLANVLRLAHNMSVDLWLDQTVRHADVVVVRLLGGPAYWPYGVDELEAAAKNGAFKLALLPGDANPDLVLKDRSTVSDADYDKLHALFTAGGPDNMALVLDAMQALADGKTVPDTVPEPFARFGCWAPGEGMIAADRLRARFDADAPVTPILFYRAALEGAGTATLTALIDALAGAGLAPMPLMISTLKESACVRFVQSAFEQHPPEVILNLTGFALALDGLEDKHNPFAGTDAPILQLVQSGRPQEQWAGDIQGLSAKDLAMQIVLPELDGRIGALIVGHKDNARWHDATECPLSAYAPDADGIRQAVTLAQNWVRLSRTGRSERRVALVLANYPIRDGRLANGVGYDAPQSTVEILKALAEAGYTLDDLPGDGNALIDRLQAGPTNAEPARGESPAILPLADYKALFATLPEKIQREVTERWGDPADDPFCRTTPHPSPLPGGERGLRSEPAAHAARHLAPLGRGRSEGPGEGAFHLPVVLLGNVAIILQPSRGYHLDEEASYHDPDLVPPHAYIATYLWLKHRFGAHALIHNGKHGNLEWLPGKATALDAASYPLALWGTLPHFYPFIVNDPGEGTQAKRRAGAVIIDHLVPPLTRAETYGPLKDLEALLDEFYAASGMDQRRLKGLKKGILEFTKDSALDKDIGLDTQEDEADQLMRIDTFLCELKEAQIRDGLHIFGQAPEGRLATDLAVSLARVPRGEEAGDASLIRALADDLRLGLDPLTAPLGKPFSGEELRQEVDRFPEISACLPKILRTCGDVVEALENIAAVLVAGAEVPRDWRAAKAVMQTVRSVIEPRLRESGPNEVQALLDGLDGKFVRPGPSGAPSRGRLDVLPTGRNFYSVDNRAVPTPTAWELGRKSAENLIERHFQDHGLWLQSVALSVWGTANMRTGGDDIAQALALIGAKPKWDPASLRVSGYEIIPLAKLGRPRVDVTLRISGLFRDAFPQLISLFDRAVRAIGALDEPEDQNPIAVRMRADAVALMNEGVDEEAAGLQAGHRIFGSKPGAYGAGLQGLMDSGSWESKADLSEAFLNWGQYAYGAQAAGIPERARFAARLGAVEAVLHNQDNREHDLLDSDDYYQFEGGLAAAAEVISGEKPVSYHNDHSRPERPLARTLEEEISKVMRSRVVNPKWISGVRRHGYKGAFEIIATVDYMFAFAATTGAVKSHHFDLAFDAFVLDEEVRDFIRGNNPYGYDELLAKFREAMDRGFWQPKSNSAYAVLEGDKV